VHVLDCENFATTLTSVAAAADVSERVLLEALRRFDPDAVDSSMDWYGAVPKAALASIGISLDASRFDAVCAFHGTRTLDPGRFLRDGIMPLGMMLDRLWNDLYSIAGGHVTGAEWRAIRAAIEAGPLPPGPAGHSAYLYRLKTKSSSLHGPYASLVRDHAIAPIEGQHDYLQIPEIVEDIARFTGTDLQDRFERAARSCLVKFRHDTANPGMTESAVTYLLGHVRGEPHGFGSVDGVDRCGLAVSAQDVIYVDEIDLARRTDPAIATVSRHVQQR
jgi:hypothetical protein